jgi:hypothetical protein
MKLQYLLAVIIQSNVAFAQYSWATLGYEMRTSGPNSDHLLFVEKGLTSKQSIMVHCRFLDKAWNDQPPLFEIPMEGPAFGVDLNSHLFTFKRLQVDFRCGTMAYKARSYYNGGDKRWFVIPTAFLNTETLIYKNIYLGIGIGAIWFLHNDSYRNYASIMHEELAFSVKYKIKSYDRVK